MKKLIFILSIFLLAVPCTARIIYVDVNTPDSNDGSSWAKAYTFLQDALADANSSGDVNEIWVAQGIYKPDKTTVDPNGTGDREATFQLVNGVALMGGYAGYGEVDPNARDFELYETILSGDLNGNDVGFANYGENSYHVVKSNSVDESTILYGFTITAGCANGSHPHYYGGGMFNWVGSPTIIDCTYRDNWSGGYGMGGGGAGMYNGGGKATLLRCIFVGNNGEWGGGLYTRDSTGSLIYCNFYNNVARYQTGGAIFLNTGGDIQAIGCKFIGNSAEDGGAVGSFLNGENTPVFRGCTFNSNSAGRGGALYVLGVHTDFWTVESCIFWGNEAGYGDEVYLVKYSQAIVGPTLTISYCDVRGGVSGISVDPNCILNWGYGNIDADPCFADVDANDFHLKSQAGRWDPNTESWVQDANTSPCIDAGDPDNPIGYEPFPNGGRINMGAYGGTAEASKSYFGAPVCETIVAGDVNGDCKVDWFDFAIMSFHWLEDNNP